MAQSSQSASQLQLEALRPMGERLDAPATYRSYFIGSYLMRKTRLGAGWTKSPRPVLQGQSAASPTVRRAATYKVLYPRCAGLDVHKDSVVARIRCVSEPLHDEVKTFATTTSALLELNAWLSSH